jgi:transposase
MRETYPSDISREQFEAVRGLLETSKKKTRPGKVDLYDVFCGVLYILKGGSQWRMLPKDYPISTLLKIFLAWRGDLPWILCDIIYPAAQGGIKKMTCGACA